MFTAGGSQARKADICLYIWRLATCSLARQGRACPGKLWTLFSAAPRSDPPADCQGERCRERTCRCRFQAPSPFPSQACQHYEEKCSGSYSPSSPAARYLYDLSRDVQDLVRVLKLQEDGLGARVRELEHLLREWQGVFGAPDVALARLGISAATGTHSPQHVARRLLALDAELREERSRHAPTDSRHAHEVAELRAALRDTGRVSREQATYEVAALQAAARAKVEEERAARCAAEAALQEARAGAAATIAAQV